MTTLQDRHLSHSILNQAPHAFLAIACFAIFTAFLPITQARAQIEPPYWHTDFAAPVWTRTGSPFVPVSDWVNVTDATHLGRVPEDRTWISIENLDESLVSAIKKRSSIVALRVNLTDEQADQHFLSLLDSDVLKELRFLTLTGSWIRKSKNPDKTEANLRRLIESLCSLERLESLDITIDAGFPTKNSEALKGAKALRWLTVRDPSSSLDSYRLTQLIAAMSQASQLNGVGLPDTSLDRSKLDALAQSALRLTHLACRFNPHDQQYEPNKFFAALAALGNLKHLMLSGPPTDTPESKSVTPQALALLQTLAKLSELNLVNLDGLTPECIAIIASFPALRVLRIFGDDGSADEDVEKLTKTKLEALWLSGSTNLTGKGLQHISAIGTLQELYIARSTNVSRADLTHLTELKNLKRVWLIGNESFTTTKAINTFARIQQLEVLPWSPDEFSKCQDALLKLGNLLEVHLSGEDVTGSTLESLASLPNLKRLSLYECTALTSKDSKHVAKMNALEMLDLSKTASWATSEGLSSVAGIKSLRLLNLSGIDKYSDEVIDVLSSIQQLRTLILDHSIDADHLETLRKALPACHIIVN